MKDNCVSPAAGLNLSRMRKLTLAFEQRRQDFEKRRDELIAKHQKQAAKEETEFAELRKHHTAECRLIRRGTLDKWDVQEEELFATYEQESVAANKHRNQSLALLRRRLKDQEKTVFRKVDSRIQAVKQQFENRKNTPGQKCRTECGQIDDALKILNDQVERARSLTTRRLGALPTVESITPQEIDDGESDPTPTTPTTTKQAVDQIAVFTRQAKTQVQSMQMGAASKTVDSFYLPAATAVFVSLWMLAAFLIAENSRYAWMFAGIPIAMLLALGVYLYLMMPLRRMTRTIYPRVERIWSAAERCAEMGRKISTDKCQVAKGELVKRRTEHLTSAARWKDEQMAELHKNATASQQGLLTSFEQKTQKLAEGFREQTSQLTASMRVHADRTAGEISGRLAKIDLELNDKKESAAAARRMEIQTLQKRVESGEAVLNKRLNLSQSKMIEQLSSWPSIVEQIDLHDATTHSRGIDFLPLGWLQTNSQQRIAVALHRRLHSTVIIQTDDQTMDDAVELVQAAIWRLLTSAGPGRTEMSLFDATDKARAHCHHFTPLMKLLDQTSTMIHCQTWTDDNEIAEQLTRLSDRSNDIVKSSLRDQFQRIEDYNRSTDAAAIAYHVIAAVGLSDGLRRGAAEQLEAIREASLRCGTFIFFVCRRDQSIPLELSPASEPRLIQLDLSMEHGWKLTGEGWDSASFEPIEPPPVNLCQILAAKVAGGDH